MTLQIQMTGTVELQETTDAADDYNFDTINGDITEVEVRKALNNLKKGKAAGPNVFLMIF